MRSFYQKTSQNVNKIKILEDKVNGLNNEVKQLKLITEKLYKKSQKIYRIKQCEKEKA